MRRLAIIAAALAGCAPIVPVDLPNGDHVVTTYVLLQGFDEARSDNLWAAAQICRGPVVLIDEQRGTDWNGLYDRLTFGCVAPDAPRAGAPASR